MREKGSEAVRTNFAAHMYSKSFAKLPRHLRMVKPVIQLFGEPVYMHQFKINGKIAFEGDLWQWHQDYRVPAQRLLTQGLRRALALAGRHASGGKLLVCPSIL